MITEIERTFSAAEALKNDEFLTFGTLMVSSHFSLKDDFEVTCSQTDQIVDLAVEFGNLNNKSIFARQTGGINDLIIYHDILIHLIDFFIFYSFKRWFWWMCCLSSQNRRYK